MAVSLTQASLRLAEQSPVMADLLARHGPARFGPKPRVEQRFETLCRSIAFQQLAGNAAAAIWGRVRALTPHWEPAAVLALGEQPLRSAGLSGAKTRAVLDLAVHCEQGSVELARLGRLHDEEVVSQLTMVRGIGPWTAQMFLIFTLRRLDVWPVGDLGVRHGYATAHGLAGLPQPTDLEPLGDPFRPFRSVAAWYCWRAASTVL